MTLEKLQRIIDNPPKPQPEPEPPCACGGRGWIWDTCAGIQACDDCRKYFTDGGVADDDAAAEAVQVYVQLLEELVRQHGPEGYPERLYSGRLYFRWEPEPADRYGNRSAFQVREAYAEAEHA